MALASMWREGEDVAVKTDYNKAFVFEVKKLGAWWNADRKFWTVKKAQYKALCALVHSYYEGIDVWMPQEEREYIWYEGAGMGYGGRYSCLCKRIAADGTAAMVRIGAYQSHE